MVLSLNVFADSTIGGVAEAAACADKFKRENVGLTITVTPWVLWLRNH